MWLQNKLISVGCTVQCQAYNKHSMLFFLQKWEIFNGDGPKHQSCLSYIFSPCDIFKTSKFLFLPWAQCASLKMDVSDNTSCTSSGGQPLAAIVPWWLLSWTLPWNFATLWNLSLGHVSSLCPNSFQLKNHPQLIEAFEGSGPVRLVGPEAWCSWSTALPHFQLFRSWVVFVLLHYFPQ